MVELRMLLTLCAFVFSTVVMSWRITDLNGHHPWFAAGCAKEG